MPLEYSDFLLILLFVVIIGIALFAYTMGALSKSEPHRKIKKRSKTKVKKSPAKVNTSDPCPRKAEGYYFGFLRKELDKSTPVPDQCLACPRHYECLTGKK